MRTAGSRRGPPLRLARDGHVPDVNVSRSTRGPRPRPGRDVGPGPSMSALAYMGRARCRLDDGLALSADPSSWRWGAASGNDHGIVEGRWR
jgi:hypothetical protein